MTNWKLKQARVAAGLRQDELGARIGVGQSAISGYETGRIMPTSHVLQLLEAALGTDDLGYVVRTREVVELAG